MAEPAQNRGRRAPTVTEQDTLWAAADGKAAQLSELIHAHGNHLVNIRDNKRRTPLHRASGNGHIDCVETLLKEGADVNLRDRANATPMHYASKTGYASVIRLLRARGGDPSAANSDGNTCLHLAAIGNHNHAAQTLLQLGANLELRNKDGKTPRELCTEQKLRDTMDQAATQRRDQPAAPGSAGQPDGLPPEAAQPAGSSQATVPQHSSSVEGGRFGVHGSWGWLRTSWWWKALEQHQDALAVVLLAVVAIFLAFGPRLVLLVPSYQDTQT